MFTENTKGQKRKDVQFVVSLTYKMFTEISYEFNARDYKSFFEIPLKEKEYGDKSIMEYSAEISLPFGELQA